jgi:DNA-binding transcriptional ArsR family regulator
MDNKTKEALKLIQTEMRQLHALVTEARAEPRAEAGVSEEPPVTSKAKADSVVQYSVTRPASNDGDAAFKTGTVSVSAAQIAKTTDEAAALLGYALSSPQKVALLRALLGHESESAAALGTAANLSTGSLYHHLRDLMHAGLIGQAGRNQYQITGRGQRVLLLLLALAAEG